MFDTFISYRRVGGGNTAARVYDYLKLKGLHPFYDITGMSSGRFDEQLQTHVINSLNYVLILSKGALDRCVDPNDWVYREIVLAISHNLNIIVLKEEGFEYPSDLPADLEVLRMFQEIQYSEQTLSSRLEIMSSMLQYRKEIKETPVYDKKLRKRFKISGEYMSFYEDVEDGRVVMRKAPVVLKNFLGRISGKTWFGGAQAWNIHAKMYGNKRLVGTYFAKSNLDDGIGNFFLNVVDANTLEGFWSGYDNANSTITTGKYVFRRRYDGYSIRRANVSDFPSVIKIADVQLGDDYLTKERLQKTLDKDLTDEILVAVENATDSVVAFCLYKQISYDEATKICQGNKLRNLMFAENIGYVATVATKEEFKHLGIATALVKRCLDDLRNDGVTCFISTAWKHAGITNIASVLESHGFIREFEMPKYWYESSLREGYSCPRCGNPCTCSCVLYTKIK